MQVAIVPELFFHAAFIFIPAPHITSPLEATFFVCAPTNTALHSLPQPLLYLGLDLLYFFK